MTGASRPAAVSPTVMARADQLLSGGPTRGPRLT